jgi:hypothetical protein
LENRVGDARRFCNEIFIVWLAVFYRQPRGGQIMTDIEQNAAALVEGVAGSIARELESVKV